MYEYEDYEDYFEPGEFDEEIERMKEALRKSVKKEIQDELQRLREENKNLQGIKEHFEQIKKDFERKKSECDRIIANAERNAMGTRLVKLLDAYKLVLWSPDYKYHYKKKCDKCDRWRNIKFTLPSGKVVDDKCSCNESERVAYPAMYMVYEMNDRHSGLTVWYKKCGKSGDEYIHLDCASRVPKLVIDHNMKFEEIPTDREVFFATYEECMAYCEYLTPDREAQGYLYRQDGTIVEKEESEC